MEYIDNKININDAIALCYIIDEFETFKERLMVFISLSYNRDFANKLREVSLGKFKIGAKNEKKFYNENKKIIDTINKYTNIVSFINHNYNFYGQSSNKLERIYGHILEHKDEIRKIISTLEALKYLNFEYFMFDKNIDFTKESYKVDRNYHSGRIVYLSKMEIIPSDDSMFIKYKTLHSNYKIEFERAFLDLDYSSNIILNSLLFDSGSLPEKVSVDYACRIIDNLRKEKEYRDLKTSVNLNANAIDLNRQIETINSIISKTSDFKTKQELIELLEDLKQNSEKLQNINSQYSDLVVQSTSITSEQLEEEKQKFLKG